MYQIIPVRPLRGMNMILVALVVILTASALGLVLLCTAMSLTRRQPQRRTVERIVERTRDEAA